MKRPLLIIVLVCLFIKIQTCCMQQVQSSYLIPTQFHLATAFDQLSVPGICQTLTFAASIALLYKAADVWAQSKSPFKGADIATAKQEELNQQARQGRRIAFRYLVAGLTFTTAGFIQRYNKQILSALSFIKRFV